MLFLSQHVCYQLRSIQCHDDAKEEWVPVDPKTIFVTMQLGSKYGMLNVDFQCECCDRRNRFDYFFSMCDTDVVYATRMKPRLCDGPKKEQPALTLYFPNGDRGCFEMVNENPEFSDGYILGVAACANWANSTEVSLKLLFRTIRHRIQLRTAWKKLYYRCFRLAFHPKKSAGKRVIAEW